MARSKTSGLQSFKGNAKRLRAKVDELRNIITIVDVSTKDVETALKIL